MAVPLSITMGWRVRLWVQHPFGSYASIKIIKLIDRNIFVTVHMECFYIHIGLVKKKKKIYIYIYRSYLEIQKLNETFNDYRTVSD